MSNCKEKEIQRKSNVKERERERERDNVKVREVNDQV